MVCFIFFLTFFLIVATIRIGREIQCLLYAAQLTLWVSQFIAVQCILAQQSLLGDSGVTQSGADGDTGTEAGTLVISRVISLGQ